MFAFFNQRPALISHAKACIGKPYAYGATTGKRPRAFDCSSLVQYLYQSIGIAIPRSSIEQAALGKVVSARKGSYKLRVGDLLFFRSIRGHYNPQFPEGIGHVAIYIGDDTCIHATGSAGKVIAVASNALLQREDLVVVKRVV